MIFLNALLEFCAQIVASHRRHSSRWLMQERCERGYEKDDAYNTVLYERIYLLCNPESSHANLRPLAVRHSYNSGFAGLSCKAFSFSILAS